MSWRRRLLAPVRSRLRSHAQAVAREGGQDLELLERYLRSPGQVANEDLPLGSPFLRLTARMVAGMEPDGLREALRRGHYRAMSRIEEPVWRRYSFRGFDVVHDIRNKSQWNAYIRDSHQPGITHWLRQYCRTGGRALDIGANAGVLSLEMLAAMGPQGRVFAFEPNPEASELLEAAITGNALQDRLFLIPWGLGVRTQEVTLSVPAVNNGAAAFRDPLPGESTLTVSVVGFEEWWADQGWPVIDCVKIDVEGFEGAVVNALRPMLERDHPPVIVEVDPAASGDEVTRALQALDYRLYEVLHQPPYRRNLTGGLAHKADILAIPAGPAGP